MNPENTQFSSDGHQITAQQLQRHSEVTVLSYGDILFP